MTLPVTAVILTAWILTTAAADDVRIIPPSLVVQYGASASAVCYTNVTHYGMGWEASQNGVDMTTDVQQLTWKVNSLTYWDIEPTCYINMDRIADQQVIKVLPVVVYKIPDLVSSTFKNHNGPVVKGRSYELQCLVQSVAPARNLSVKWYKDLIEVRIASFSIETKKDVTVSDSLQIVPDRADEGVQYRCEAVLELGADGPQPPPRVSSTPLTITVHYMPRFNSSVEVLRDGENVLNCTVTSNPPATYSWESKHLKEKISGSIYTSSSLNPGNYTCTAENKYGRAQKFFIVHPIDRDRSTFWIILGIGLALATVLTVIAGYSVVKTARKNSVI